MDEASSVTWILESDVFSSCHDQLRSAIRAAGHIVVDWNEDWLATRPPTSLSRRPVVFHGSLGNADLVSRTFDWTPGAFCETGQFHCSAWYEEARPWLLHRDWVKSTVAILVDDPHGVAGGIATAGRVFVRPDSPLKPFSGRVLRLDDVSLQSLDHGFYFEDIELPIMLAPVRLVGREWRFVVADQQVVAGSAYEAQNRTGTDASLDTAVWDYASRVARQLTPPQRVYVLDVCDCEGSLHLIEMNPFGGADLYGCDTAAIVEAVSRIAAD